MNTGGLIHDWPSLELFPWPDPNVADTVVGLAFAYVDEIVDFVKANNVI